MPSAINNSMYLQFLNEDIRDCLVQLDRLILRTPTGETRNKLTDANLHLVQVNDIVKNLNFSDWVIVDGFV